MGYMLVRNNCGAIPINNTLMQGTTSNILSVTVIGTSRPGNTIQHKTNDDDEHTEKI